MGNQAALRARLRERRRSLPTGTVDDAAAAIAWRWAAVPLLAGANVAVSVADDGEIDLAALARGLRARGAHTWYPVSASPTDDPPMLFRQWDGATPMIEGRFGIPIPAPTGVPDRSGTELDVVAVPLVAFDHDGHRLGRGGGYYDRAFAARVDSGPPPLLVGAAYDFQEVDALATAPWDVAVDLVITPTRVLRFVD